MGRHALQFILIASQIGRVRFSAGLSFRVHVSPAESLADPALPERRAGVRVGLMRHAVGYIVKLGVL
jgi:hypothetical protein